MNYFEYETEDATFLYVEWDSKDGIITDLLIETDRGLEASERRYQQIEDYIYSELLDNSDSLKSVS